MPTGRPGLSDRCQGNSFGQPGGAGNLQWRFVVENPTSSDTSGVAGGTDLTWAYQYQTLSGRTTLTTSRFANQAAEFTEVAAATEAVGYWRISEHFLDSTSFKAEFDFVENYLSSCMLPSDHECGGFIRRALFWSGLWAAT